MKSVETSCGRLYADVNSVSGTTPIVFLHGVYFDHRLWDGIAPAFSEHTTVAVDMPLHGRSKTGVPAGWNLDDVSEALVELLDALEIEHCYAIGHSWGSMTILRAAAQHPERFVGIGLGNMPLDPGTAWRRWTFSLQHTMLPWRGFYTRQAAKALYSTQSLKADPGLVAVLRRSMDLLSDREVRQTDRAVITHADDGHQYVTSLKVPALGLVGQDDYVGISPRIETRTVPGGHVSPLEATAEFIDFVGDVLSLRQ